MTSKINRVHPLVIVNMSAKFDEDVHNSLVAIPFTRIRRDTLTDAQTDGTTAALLYPLRNALHGDKNNLEVLPWITNLPSYRDHLHNQHSSFVSYRTWFSQVLDSEKICGKLK